MTEPRRLELRRPFASFSFFKSDNKIHERKTFFSRLTFASVLGTERLGARYRVLAKTRSFQLSVRWGLASTLLSFQLLVPRGLARIQFQFLVPWGLARIQSCQLLVLGHLLWEAFAKPKKVARNSVFFLRAFTSKKLRPGVRPTRSRSSQNTCSLLGRGIQTRCFFLQGCRSRFLRCCHIQTNKSTRHFQI